MSSTVPKITKGYIKNTVTTKVMSFIYNPETMSISRATNFVELTSPGVSYPQFQYVSGGSKSIDFKLLLAGDTTIVQNWIDFLEDFQPSEDFDANFAPPPTMILSFGSLAKECIVDSYDWNYQMWDANLKPTMVEVDIKLRVV